MCRPIGASESWGYRDANHPRPMPKAATPAPTSMSKALCGPESNPAACPNQKSPRAINSGPAATRTIFIRALPRSCVSDSELRRPALLKKGPAIGDGFSLGRNCPCKSIRGSAMCHNSHTERKTLGSPPPCEGQLRRLAPTGGQTKVTPIPTSSPISRARRCFMPLPLQKVRGIHPRLSTAQDGSLLGNVPLSRGLRRPDRPGP
jgi:hypothetical protein